MAQLGVAVAARRAAQHQKRDRRGDGDEDADDQFMDDGAPLRENISIEAMMIRSVPPLIAQRLGRRW